MLPENIPVLRNAAVGRDDLITPCIGVQTVASTCRRAGHPRAASLAAVPQFTFCPHPAAVNLMLIVRNGGLRAARPTASVK